jgi:hypothetical protein
MEHNLKLFLAKVKPRETGELVADHVRRLALDRQAKTVTLLVDKRYALNLVISHGHIERVIQAVKKTFGDEFATIVKLENANAAHEREKALPHTIHFH